MKRVIATLMFVHRYLGLAFCLIFVIWFASGIVMVYKRMPEYSAEERLARLPALDALEIRLTAGRGADGGRRSSTRRGASCSPRSSRGLLYRFVVDGGSSSVYADDGSYVDLVEPETAVAIVGDAFPESRRHRAVCSARLEEPDQWTINNRFSVSGLLHHVGLGDAAGTEPTWPRRPARS